MENWKDILGFEGLYQVSDMGGVRSCNHLATARYRAFQKMVKGKLLHVNKDSDGYSIVCLSKEGFKKTKRVSKLVANAFIPNPNNHPHINHLDGNKDNNAKTNLAWATIKENINHAFDTGLMKKFRKIPVAIAKYDLENSLLSSYISYAEAEKEGFNRNHIRSVIRGDRKSHRGFLWKFAITETSGRTIPATVNMNNQFDPSEEKAKAAEELKDGPETGSEGQAESIPEKEGAGELID